MKKLIIFLVFLVPVTSVEADELAIDAKSAPALFNALIRAGAQSRGSNISRTVSVIDLECSGNYNYFLRKAVASCNFFDENKDIQISGRRAQALLRALVLAKLAKRGPTKMFTGSVKALDCTVSNFGGLSAFSCNALN